MTTMLALVLEELERAAEDDGHCFLRRDELHARMLEQVDTAVVDAAHGGYIVRRGDHIYLKRLDDAEQRVVTRVLTMLRGSR